MSVMVNPLPTASITGTGTDLCPGDSLLLTASGGSTYLWSTGANTSNIYVDTPGNYTVTAFNGCGSQVSAPYTVNALNAPLANITGITVLCPGGLVHLTGSGGSSYLWSTGEGTAAITVNAPGTYILTAINACGTDTAKADIDADPIAALFTADPVSGMAPLTVNLTNLSSGSPASFAWDFGNGSNSSLVSPSVLYNDGGTYVITLIATSSAGCHASYALNIEVGENPSSLNIPNVFSPNGDKTNDVFLVQGAFLESFEATILDRWGKQVAHWNNPTDGWDGTDENGNPVSEGTYFYLITATGTDDKTYNENGQLTLFR
jgi:gliding motility-associated-like protein